MADFAGARKPATGASLAADPALPVTISPITRELSEYIASALARPLPAEVAEKAKCHLLDTLAAMVSGSRLLPGKRAIAYVRAQGGRREATVVGSRTITTAVNAALATAELAERDGARLLRALALGYDIGARFVMALGLGIAYGRPHSTHSLGGLFGAAAAAGALLGLEARRVRFQLSYAVQQASGLAYWMRDPEHIEKAFDFGGMPARNAVAAATMAAGASPRSRIRSPGRAPSSSRSRRRRDPKPWSRASAAGSRSCRRRSRNGPRARRSRRRSTRSTP